MTDAMKRMMVIGYGQDVKARIIECLAARNGWQPVYWMAKDHYGAALRARFPGLMFHSNQRAEETLPPKEMTAPLRAIADADLVERMAKHEPALWPLFLRRTPPPSSQRAMDLKHEYYKTLTLFYNVFLEIRPDVALFSHMPHHFYSYALYLFCREFGTQTIVFARTRLPRRLETVVSSFEEGSIRIKQRVEAHINSNRLDEIELSEANQRYLESLQTGYREGMPEYLKDKFAVSDETGKLLSQNAGIREYLNLILLPGYRRTPFDLFARAKMIFKRRRMLRYYETLTSPIDPNTPYIAVSLHRQPEASNSPTGGTFVHQLLMVDMLSRALPEGWNLYVKEHPSQVHWQSLNDMFRTTGYYDALLEIPDVRLVSSNEPAFSLIDGAKIVATVAGTTGWEAVNRGKPTLVFGFAWYRFCEGVFYVPTYKDCQRAIEHIAGGYTVDRAKLRAFVKAWEDEGLPKFSYDKDQLRELGEGDYAQLMADAITERLEHLDAAEAAGTIAAQRRGIAG